MQECFAITRDAQHKVQLPPRFSRSCDRSAHGIPSQHTAHRRSTATICYVQFLDSNLPESTYLENSPFGLVPAMQSVRFFLVCAASILESIRSRFQLARDWSRMFSPVKHWDKAFALIPHSLQTETERAPEAVWTSFSDHFGLSGPSLTSEPPTQGIRVMCLPISERRETPQHQSP